MTCPLTSIWLGALGVLAFAAAKPSVVSVNTKPAINSSLAIIASLSRHNRRIHGNNAGRRLNAPGGRRLFSVQVSCVTQKTQRRRAASSAAPGESSRAAPSLPPLVGEGWGGGPSIGTEFAAPVLSSPAA